MLRLAAMCDEVESEKKQKTRVSLNVELSALSCFNNSFKKISAE
jgi:hypothetical protein